MLMDLRIRDLAIIENIELRFADGFNVISGETGAGKSIILHALGLCLGTRASADMVRAGADAARVVATFDVGAETAALLAQLDIEHEPAEPLVIQRVVTAAGRSRASIDGMPVAASTLRAVGATLVDYASQHESAVLLDEQRHRPILDRYAGISELAGRVADAVAQLRQAEAELDELRRAERQRAGELDLSRHELGELREADPQPQEDRQLQREMELLRSAHQLQAALGTAEQLLYSGQGAAVEQVGAALRQLRSFSNLDEQIEVAVQQLQESYYVLQDVGRSVGGIARRVVSDTARIEEIEERRQLLAALQRKHRTDLGGLIARIVALEERIAELDHSEIRMDDLGRRVVALRQQAEAGAGELTCARREAADELQRGIGVVLADLAMGGASFVVAVDPDPAGLTATGCDRVTFQLSANRGEPIRALSRVASGGELSRVLLAVKEVLREASPVDTFVLDEIDTGIGGNTAQAVGERLQAMARRQQLIVITHLPQIAARGTSHVRVGKHERDGRTTVWAEQLDERGRLSEVARMVAGDRHGERSRALAQEMLDV